MAVTRAETLFGEGSERPLLPVASSHELMGSLIRGYVKLKFLMFPKKEVSTIIPGSFGIVRLSLVDLEEGVMPEEMNTSFLPSQQSFEFVATGSIPTLGWDILYYFEGVLIEHSTYGPQYSIKELHKINDISTPEQKLKFLSLIFSPSKMKLLTEAVEDPYALFDNRDLDTLKSIKGIGEVTARQMINKFETNLSNAGDVVQLSKYHLTPNQLAKMSDVYHSIDTIMYFIENDPYVFIETIPGIGWEKADEIAINNGMNPCCSQRIAAYVNYYLTQQANNIGHVWVPLEELLAAIEGIAPRLSMEDLQSMLRLWTGQQEEQDFVPWLYYEADTRRIGLSYYRKMEEQIASELMRLRHGNAVSYSDEEINNAIQESEAECGFEYTEEQKEAVRLSFKNNVVFITGCAGSGKSTSVSPLVHAMKKADLDFHQCALSGKASSNLTEITGEKGYTIHRLLGYSGETRRFTRDSKNPLSTSMVIVDELSMVDDWLFLCLLRAIPTGARLICLGDIQQLESIGAGNIALDMLSSPLIATKRLTKIHRQAARSGIITESLRVSAGEQIVSHTPVNETRGELKDLRIRSYTDAVLSEEYVLEEYEKLLADGVTARDIGVIVPLRERGTICCEKLNSKLQDIVNPLVPNLPFVEIGKDDNARTLRLNDKILITTNHYSKCVSPEAAMLANRFNSLPEVTEHIPIFNGNWGFITKIMEKWLIVDLAAQGEVAIPKEFWKDVSLGYAMTCHRAQGSGFPIVIVGLDMSAYSLLSKEWLYTALTRAKKSCILVSQISAARQATVTTRVLAKHSWLKETLVEAEAPYLIQNSEDVERKIIPLGFYKYKPSSIKKMEACGKMKEEESW